MFVPFQLYYFERVVKLTLRRIETGEGPIRRNGITLLNSIAVTVDSKDKELMGDYGTIHVSTVRLILIVVFKWRNLLVYCSFPLKSTENACSYRITIEK